MSEKVNKVQIQTISTCNADCVFCPYSESWHKANPGKMKLSLYNKILVDIEELPSFHTLCPYFENEPMTDSRMVDLIQLFYDKYPDKAVELSVNPSMLTKNNIKKLIKVFKDKEHYLPVSFHGINEGTFQHIMDLPWKSSLSQVINLLKMSDGALNVLIRGSGRSLDNRIVYFTEGHYLGFWQDVCKEYGLDPAKIAVQPFAFHNRADQISRNERNASFNQYGPVRVIDEDTPFSCLRFDQVFHTLWNGDISACCMDYKKEIDFLGNINDMTIKEFYESEPYKKWVSMGTGKIETPKEFICKHCISPGG